ncbi:MAG: right-handed parallel beta-helix repeat-containing protein [Acidobacteriota bacterium]|nr:right-handed parallel beta-helix repeat-containing protein [Acidobacteriota bacterium]
MAGTRRSLVALVIAFAVANLVGQSGGREPGPPIVRPPIVTPPGAKGPILTPPSAAPTSAAPVSSSQPVPLIHIPHQTAHPVQAGTGPSLPGCIDPNIPLMQGGWSSVTSPVYGLIQNMPLIGTPAYAANTVFWISRESQPGKSAVMTGAFTPASKTLKIAWIPPGTVDTTTLLAQSSQTVTPVQVGTTALSFEIPASLAAGVYAYEIDDNSTAPVQGVINAPNIDWLLGMPANNSTPLLHEALSCVAEAGQQLALMGRNFSATLGVYARAADGTTYNFSVVSVSTTQVIAQLPASLPPGAYSVWIGDAAQGAVSSAPVPLAIASPHQWPLQHIACGGLTGDGATDNSGALQSCLDTYQPGYGNIFCFDLPAGTYLLSQGIAPHPWQALCGASPTQTILLGAAKPGTAQPAWIVAPTYFAMQGLTLQASAAVLPLLQPANMSSPWTSGHIWLNNVALLASHEAGYQTVFLEGPDVQLTNSTVQASLDLDCANGALVAHNTFNDDAGYVALGNSQNVLFVNNTLTAQSQTSIEGVSIARQFVQYGPSYQSRNIYLAGNLFSGVGTDQQVITTDGGGGAYWGGVLSSTANTVSLADEPSWNWTGNTNPQDVMAVVLSGTGAGQALRVLSYSGNTVTLAAPWAVPPDATSVLGIAFYHSNLTVAGNTFVNTSGITINLGDVVNGAIEDNLLTNSGSGILLWGFGPYGGPAGYGSVVNVDVLRNVIAEGDGTKIVNSTQTNAGGIGLFDMTGCVVSGVLIRDNTVTPLQTIFSTNGWEGLNGIVIDGNNADVLMQGAPRTLVDDALQ